MEIVQIALWLGMVVSFLMAIIDTSHTLMYVLVGLGCFFIFPFTVEFLLCLLSPSSSPHLSPLSSEFQGKFPLIYSPKYNIETPCKFEKMHPFDSSKYRRIFNRLVDAGLINEDNTIEPRSISRADLLLVHSMWYLIKLQSSCILSSVLEVPLCVLPSCFIRHNVITPMMYAANGSILGAQLAVERNGWAINLSGGYHHASGDSGGGFCAIADITLAIRHLRRKVGDKAKKVMIVDLDAHQGNGHERDFLMDPNTFILDMFNPRIYPNDQHAKAAIACTVHITPRHSDRHYLSLLNRHLTESLDAFQPDFLLYNAGTDCLQGDALGRLNITPEGIIKRDEMVFRACFERERRIPILMVLSGGYQMSNATVIADSIVNLHEKFDLFNAQQLRNQ